MENIFWNYGSDGAKISAGVAVCGTILNVFVGGWDKMIALLCLLMAVDFVLGFLAASKAGKVNSKVMFWGGINKLLVLLLVAVAVQLDAVLPVSEPYIRTAVIWFYSGREGISLVENYGKMGLPLPPFLVKLLEQLKDSGGFKK
ncbi:MAG: phage holin family protein [Oscillospiraceae bacterium]